MKTFPILLAVSMFLFIDHASTQSFTNYTVTSISTTLCHNHITSIAIDNEGNKWLGTPEGVSKFDGTSWTTYNTADGLADNFVQSIAIDSQANKWFGKENGISKLSGEGIVG